MSWPLKRITVDICDFTQKPRTRAEIAEQFPAADVKGTLRNLTARGYIRNLRPGELRGLFQQTYKGRELVMMNSGSGTPRYPEIKQRGRPSAEIQPLAWRYGLHLQQHLQRAWAGQGAA